MTFTVMIIIESARHDNYPCNPNAINKRKKCNSYSIWIGLKLSNNKQMIYSYSLFMLTICIQHCH